MKEMKHDLLRTKFTYVCHEDEEDMRFNAPHHFKVHPVPGNEYHAPLHLTDEEEPTLALIHFQEGPILEEGVNGVGNEDLIAMVICRLEHFQDSEWNCRENALAITKLEEALLWLRKRTMGRESRGVEGTHNK